MQDLLTAEKAGEISRKNEITVEVIVKQIELDASNGCRESVIFKHVPILVTQRLMSLGYTISEPIEMGRKLYKISW